MSGIDAYAIAGSPSGVAGNVISNSCLIVEIRDAEKWKSLHGQIESRMNCSRRICGRATVPLAHT